MRWFSTARFAQTLVDSGFEVALVAPAGHPARIVEGIETILPLDPWKPQVSIERAIEEVHPDILLPDDERALACLRSLYWRSGQRSPYLRSLIAHSLGSPDHWPVLTSRTGLSERARSLGIAAPAGTVVDGFEALNGWAQRCGYPVVLKTDASWGGGGVIVVNRPEELTQAYRRSSSPVSLLRALRRAIVQRDAGSLRMWKERTPPVVNVQAHVTGTQAIATVAALAGEMIGCVAMEVMRVMFPRGPAAVIRLVDQPAMVEAARRLAATFGLSGLFGIDFIVNPAGEPVLIELNQRLTPTCHFLFEGDRQPGQAIGLFPQEPIRDPHSAWCQPPLLDLPTSRPVLEEAGWREQRYQQKILNWFAPKT